MNKNKNRNKDFKPNWCSIELGTILRYNESKDKGIVVGYNYPFILVLSKDRVNQEDVYELTYQFRIVKR